MRKGVVSVVIDLEIWFDLYSWVFLFTLSLFAIADQFFVTFDYRWVPWISKETGDLVFVTNYFVFFMILDIELSFSNFETWFFVGDIEMPTIGKLKSSFYLRFSS